MLLTMITTTPLSQVNVVLLQGVLHYFVVSLVDFIDLFLALSPSKTFLLLSRAKSFSPSRCLSVSLPLLSCPLLLSFSLVQYFDTSFPVPFVSSFSSAAPLVRLSFIRLHSKLVFSTTNHLSNVRLQWIENEKKYFQNNETSTEVPWNLNGYNPCSTAYIFPDLFISR